MIKNLSVWTIAVGVGTTAVCAQPTIDRLAPEDSIVVVSIKNVQNSMERLKRTGVWALWESQPMKDLRADALEQCEEKLNELLQEIGVEEGSLVPPQGPVGFAVFPVMQEDLHVASPGFLLAADFGSDADKTGRLIDAAIARADEEDVEYEQKDVLGRTVYSFDLSEIEVEVEDVFDLEDAEMDEMAPMMPMGDPTDMFGEMGTLHYVRDGSRFMFCSDLDTLTEALEVIDGDGQAGLDTREDFQAVMGRLGEVDAYAVLLTRDLARVVGGDNPMMVGWIQGMVAMFIGEIKGLGFGVRLDGPAAMVEQSFAVYMPNGKAGLTALMDTETPRRDPPPFVGPDTISYSSMSFEFDGVTQLVTTVMRMNPMPPPEGEQSILEIESTLDRLFATLGSEVHMMSTLTRPITAESMQGVFAIRCVDPQGFENFIAEHGPQIGLESRDFLGQRIYTMAAPPFFQMPGMPMMPGGGYSIGVTGGYVVIGPTAAVEQALRATGQGDLPSLAGEPAYQQAVGALPVVPAVAWGFTDTVEYMEGLFESIQFATAQSIEQMKAFDPEAAAQIEQEMGNAFGWWESLDMKLLRRYIGPSSWQVRSTEDGFVGTSYLLAAGEAEE